MTSQRDIIHIFEKLRGGAVPERAVETFAVGIEPQRDEIKRQLELLRHMGCEYGQGFYFSRPVAAPIAEAMISKQYEAERHLRRG